MKQPFDDTTKSYYRRFFEARGLHAIPQYEVFSRGRSIDLVVEGLEATSPQLQQTVFAHFRQLNALEFKGIHDPLTPVDFNRIMMRVWGLGAVDESKRKQMSASPVDAPRLTVKKIARIPHLRTVTIVCVTRPDTVLTTLEDVFGFRKSAEAGIYYNDTHVIPVWIIHPSELTLKPQNYPLLALARGEKLAQFVEICLKDNLVDYLQLLLDIGLTTDPVIIWQRIMEILGMELTVTKETWPYIDEFFRKVPEAYENLPLFRAGFEKAVREELEKEIEETIQIEVEKAVQETRAVTSTRSKQQMLVRALTRKFGNVPTAIVEVVEKTKSESQLEEWLDTAIMVNRLTEINFGLE